MMSCSVSALERHILLDIHISIHILQGTCDIDVHNTSHKQYVCKHTHKVDVYIYILWYLMFCLTTLADVSIAPAMSDCE